MTGKMSGGECGFSLVELLVALAIMAMTTVILTSLLASGRRQWQAARNDEGQVQIESVQRLLRDVISTARVAARGEPGSSSSGLKGASSSIAVRVPSRTHVQPGGIYATVVEAKSSSSGTLDLVMRQTMEGDLPDASEVRTLVSDFESLRFEYLVDGRWHDEWQGKGLPKLIAVTLEFAKRDQRVWPKLFVRPVIGALPAR